MEENRVVILEETIGYKFKNRNLIQEALTHSSYANERNINKLNCNERMEYLGDAVLELVSSEYLFFEHPQMPEGELSKLRASLVCEQALASCAARLCLGDALYLGRGEDASGGRKKASVTSDALEAVIGAMYLDGGLEVVKQFIIKNILVVKQEEKVFQDNKSQLQELVQAKELGHIYYDTVAERGPEHSKEFEVVVKISGKRFGSGKGRNKKAAEQQAAAKAIEKIKEKCGE